MARFVLIHGAAHGAWCWRDVVPALEALGHEVRAIDLPSHGDDTTPLAEVTLERYAEAILAALEGPALLVGHSMAGYPVTRAAQMRPDLVARRVYLCAYTPWPGLTLTQMRKQADRQPLIEAIRFNEDGISTHFDPAMAEEKFYADCAHALGYALPRLCDQATAPMQTALPGDPVTPPGSYITCLRDGAIPPEFQQVMAARFAPEDRYELDSSHSPFFSMPQELAALLDQISRRGRR